MNLTLNLDEHGRNRVLRTPSGNRKTMLEVGSAIQKWLCYKMYCCHVNMTHQYASKATKLAKTLSFLLQPRTGVQNNLPPTVWLIKRRRILKYGVLSFWQLTKPIDSYGHTRRWWIILLKWNVHFYELRVSLVWFILYYVQLEHSIGCEV